MILSHDTLRRQEFSRNDIERMLTSWRKDSLVWETTEESSGSGQVYNTPEEFEELVNVVVNTERQTRVLPLAQAFFSFPRNRNRMMTFVDEYFGEAEIRYPGNDHLSVLTRTISMLNAFPEAGCYRIMQTKNPQKEAALVAAHIHLANLIKDIWWKEWDLSDPAQHSKRPILLTEPEVKQMGMFDDPLRFLIRGTHQWGMRAGMETAFWLDFARIIAPRSTIGFDAIPIRQQLTQQVKKGLERESMLLDEKATLNKMRELFPEQFR